MVQPTLQQHLRPSSCCPKRSWAPTTTTKLATSLRSSSSLRSIGLLALLLVSAVQQYNSSTPNKILVWNDDDDAADNRARSLDYALRCLRQTTPQLSNVTYFTVLSGLICVTSTVQDLSWRWLLRPVRIAIGDIEFFALRNHSCCHYS